VLNPKLPEPLYHQLADELSGRIRRGELPPGTRLPAEQALAKQHAIGRPTVRQALDLLARRGLIDRKRGAGTFVKLRTERVDLFSLSGTLSSFQQSGIALETKLLRRVRKQLIAPKFGNPFGGRFAFSFVRLSRVEDEPVMVEHVVLDPDVFPDLNQVSLAGMSLADVVRDHYCLEPTHGEQTFHVQPGDALTQRALGLGARQPTLLIQRTLHFPNAERALFSELYCRTDRVSFTQRLGEPPE
jgi:GntR family transcriptional regulator